MNLSLTGVSLKADIVEAGKSTGLDMSSATIPTRRDRGTRTENTCGLVNSAAIIYRKRLTCSCFMTARELRLREVDDFAVPIEGLIQSMLVIIQALIGNSGRVES